MKILKNALTGPGRGSSLRKVLVVAQFTIAIALMIGTVVIAGQLHFMQTKDMGLDIKNTVMFAGLRRINDVETFKTELRQYPHVLSITQSLGPVAGFDSSSEVDWDGKNPEENIILHHCPVDYEYLNSFRIEISEGRFFSRQITTDKSNYVLNETAVKTMGIESPVGKRFSYNGAEGIIIGVLKDFHTMIPRDPIQPLVFQISNDAWMMYVKIDENHVSTTVDHIKNVWNKYVPDHPFYYDFVDDELNEFYEKERQLRQIFTYVSCLAVFIACLGLVGLSSFLAEQKTKEIGIRKVLGGTVSSVVILLSKEFIKWMLVANVISWPIAYFIMTRWLQSYAFRMNLGPGIFFITGGTALVIAMLTVSYQAIKAATSNPVNALRYE
jgi:putative ABC transport system permease protein